MRAKDHSAARSPCHALIARLTRVKTDKERVNDRNKALHGIVHCPLGGEDPGQYRDRRSRGHGQLCRTGQAGHRICPRLHWRRTEQGRSHLLAGQEQRPLFHPVCCRQPRRHGDRPDRLAAGRTRGCLCSEGYARAAADLRTRIRRDREKGGGTGTRHENHPLHKVRHRPADAGRFCRRHPVRRSA